jgi:hypothetical protein
MTAESKRIIGRPTLGRTHIWRSYCTNFHPQRLFPVFVKKKLSCEISSSHGGEYEVQICLLGCKVKQSRYTPWRRLRGEDVYLLLILDLCTRWGWVVSVTPRSRFTPEERTPITHCTGGWVGPRASLDTEARGKILCPCRGSNLDSPVAQKNLKNLMFSGLSSGMY